LEIRFSRKHGCHAPETLIIVAFIFGLVGRHVVVVCADLEEEALFDDIVVGVVVGVVPIVY
jgi:hypothetical protein